MSVPLLEAIADAIMHFEGWYAGSCSYGNRNPGNLEAVVPFSDPLKMRKRQFPSLIEGYQALLDDLKAKVTGHNTHGLGPESTLFALFQVYAPTGDRNDPRNYAQFVSDWLKKTYNTQAIVAGTRIDHIYQIVGQEMPDGVTAA